MDAYAIIVQLVVFAVHPLCGSVTDNFRNKIALEVLKVSPVNTVVSSMALKLALCKLTSVARGPTRTELMSALGVKDENLINCFHAIRKQLIISMASELLMHNRIYLNDSIRVNPDFGKDYGQFGVRVDSVGFRFPRAASKYVNRWVASETLNRVSTLLDEDDINNDTSMVFLSGLHFKGCWETPFDLRYTTNKPFRDDKNTRYTTQMMTKLGNFDYADDINYQVKVLNLKFTSMGSSITFIMPEKKDGIPALLDRLSKEPKMIDNIRSSLRNKYLMIYLPRIKIKTYVDWTDFLRIIGINKILDKNNRDLDGILKNGTSSKVPVHLSLVKQKVFIDLDEMGVSRYIKDRDDERAVDEMALLGSNAEEFVLDQPFYFTVTLEINGVLHELFNGVYRRPET